MIISREDLVGDAEPVRGEARPTRMSSLRWVLAFSAVLVVTAGCGVDASPNPEDTTSGVQGRTIVDGGCPVIQEGTPCPNQPLPAHLEVTAAGSNTVLATAESDDEGEFRIPLPPGHYVLNATNLTGAILPAAAPVEVNVEAGRYTQVTVAFDSGVR